MLARVLVAGGASALVFDLMLAAGVVDFGADCAAAILRCLRFFRLKVIVPVLCVGGVHVGFSVDLESARPICCLASSSDCVINRVSRRAGSVPCTLGTDGVVLSGVANDFAMAECWWMACSVSSTSSRISSAPLELVMSLIAFVHSAIMFMTLSAWVMVGFVICL